MLKKFPVLPLKDLILFPSANVPILVGRAKSVKAVKFAKENNVKILALTQKNFNVEEIEKKDLYTTGVLIEVQEMVSNNDNFKILILAHNVVKVEEIYFEDDIIFADVQENVNYKYDSEVNLLVYKKNIIETFEAFCKAQKKYSIELFDKLNSIEDIFSLVYFIMNNIHLKTKIKQQILESFSAKEITNLLLFELNLQLSILETEKKLKVRIKTQVEEAQKKYYLNEQINAIKEELGENEDKEFNKYEAKINKTPLSEHAKQTALIELKKLKNLHPVSVEAGIVKNYLDFLLDLPWKKNTKINENLEQVKSILNEHHFGMEEIKERVFELIVQRIRVKNIEKPPVLCFVGPPGTGKTSLAFSIGNAIGYKTIVIPLGGVKDESLLKGHKKTYIGAMPGKILQALKDAGSSNVVIVLEEIGAIGQDWKGSAEDVLLELLDNIQNKNFQDHYLSTGFDLSGVVFIATANSLYSLKPAIVDRLEIIEVSGYTIQEKKQIVKNYSISKICKMYSVNEQLIKIADEEIEYIIENYTYEAGLRELERVLETLIRKVMLIFETTKQENFVEINKEFILKHLKNPKYEKDFFNEENKVGVINGLAYISKKQGQEGEVLKIEGSLVPGDGKIECTGSLGNVMKESVTIAYKAVLAIANEYNLDLSVMKTNNLFIHFPSGAVPKDGPSAGVAIACVIFSCLTNKTIPSNIALTGEISLHNVLKIGGVKEKILAAYRNKNITKVLLPSANKHDLATVPSYVVEKINVVLMNSLKEAIKEIFEI